MDAKQLIAAVRRRRAQELDLGGGKKIIFTRPPEVEMNSILKFKDGKATWLVDVDHVKKYVVGWDGFTEADLLGAAVGAADPVAFDADLWAAYVEDDNDLVSKVASAILEAVVNHINSKAAVSGN